MIFGKLLGGLFGFAWFGIVGGLLGAYIGHLFDRGLAQNFGTASAENQEQIQAAFFRCTFVMLGFVAKADGRVSKSEIEWAEQVMSRLSLTQVMRKEAIDLFNLGKAASLDLDEELYRFQEVAGRQPAVMQMFLEIQILAAYADDSLSTAERELLQRACQRLNISQLRFEAIHGRIQAERAFAQGQFGGHSRGAGINTRDQLRQAYKVIGVEEDTSDREVKKAYRRLMSQHHPDKLVAKGLPEEMMVLAKEKTQEIQAAYELIKDSRKLAQ